MLKKNRRGFTLIELLVVIAIIGLLASIIIVNMQGTKFKAHDTNIKSYLHQIRNVAELKYAKDENYNVVCEEMDVISTLSNIGEFGILEKAIEKDNNGQTVWCYADSANDMFAISSSLRLGNNWCVESAGLSVEIENPIFSARCQ